MKNNILKIGLISSLLSGISLNADQTINLNNGWNLIGVTNLDANLSVTSNIDSSIKLIVTNINGAWKKFDPTKSYLQQFNSFEGGRGYWIKSDGTSSISFIGTNKDTKPSLSEGWNLVSFGSNENTLTLLDNYDNSGYKIGLMVTNINGAWKKFDPAKSYLQQFSNLDPQQGYWVKVTSIDKTNTSIEEPPSTPVLETNDYSITTPPLVPGGI